MVIFEKGAYCEVNAVIYLDAPDWQIGQDVTVYFPDTMVKHCKCELLKEQEVLKPKKIKGYNPPMYTIYEYECEKCKSPMMNKQPFCMGCGRAQSWE